MCVLSKSEAEILVQSFNYILSSISFVVSVQMTENVDTTLLALGLTFTCR